LPTCFRATIEPAMTDRPKPKPEKQKSLVERLIEAYPELTRAEAAKAIEEAGG
jgi:hypothetical protein